MKERSLQPYETETCLGLLTKDLRLNLDKKKKKKTCEYFCCIPTNLPTLSLFSNV